MCFVSSSSNYIRAPVAIPGAIAGYIGYKALSKIIKKCKRIKAYY